MTDLIDAADALAKRVEAVQSTWAASCFITWAAQAHRRARCEYEDWPSHVTARRLLKAHGDLLELVEAAEAELAQAEAMESGA